MNNIKELRLKLLLTQAQLAKEIGICSGSLVSLWEKEHIYPSMAHQIELHSFAKKHGFKLKITRTIHE